MTDWKALHAKKDLEEQTRIRERQKVADNLHRQYRLSSSAPSQKTTLASLFSGSTYHPGGGGELRQRQTALAQPQDRVRLEQGMEALRDQIGVISDVLFGINQNIEQNHHANLDRFDGLKAQITRENRRLMAAVRDIRRESDCDLSDPTTYIHCLKLMYVLIFRIFKFLCELVFVVGNSFKRFLSHMPFPFSLLVFIAYIFEMVLIAIIFDTTVRVSTLGISHREFIPHNALFGHSSGAPNFISPRDTIYQGLIRSALFVLSQIIILICSAYQSVLGRDIAMIQRETGRYISGETIVEGVKKHVVEPLADKASEQVQSVVNDVVNDQVGIMASIPRQIGNLAAQGAQGAGSLAGKALEGVGSLAQGAGEVLAARAEKLRQIDPGDVKDSARAAADAAMAAGENTMHFLRRFGSGVKSKFMGGSGQTKGRSINRTRGRSRNRTRGRTRSRTSAIIPVFSILTQNEQEEFNQTIAGKKIKQLEHMINSIDYSKIQPNPRMFYMIRFALNVAEKLFPVFIKELDRTTKVCKLMKHEGIQPVSNPLFLKQLSDIVIIDK
jgi:hypothetical protein